MSLKGGYQIINLKNKEFNSSMNNSEYYKDIYFNMVNSHAKMIIVSGLNMDGVKYNDYETIFYEVEQPDDNPYFQCIARRIWNTKDYKCITKYINIYSDDRVTCTQEEFIYEILPDGELSITSTNALQNKVITKNINRIDEVNEQQDERLLNIENLNTLQDASISANRDAINKNAVQEAEMPQITLKNSQGTFTTTAYVYKYMNGLCYIAIDVVMDFTNTFFGHPVTEIKIDNFYNKNITLIQRAMISSPSYTKPCEVDNTKTPSLVLAGFNGGDIVDAINENTQIIITLISAEN